jgi:hypothetical protein
MIKLSENHIQTLVAFLDSFDMALTGAWPAVDAMMRDEFGIDDPEGAMAEIREALAG